MSKSRDSSVRARAERLVAEGFPDYRLAEVERAGGRLRLTLEPRGKPVCPDCGRVCGSVHATVLRLVRDLPALGCQDVTLVVPVRRVRCVCGGRKQERLAWVRERARMTGRLADWLRWRLLDGVSVNRLARECRLHWTTVRQALSPGP